MKNELEKKYGLITAISMVVGIVIGSGVFFKAESILAVTEGNLPIGIISWIIGGLIMLSCISMFAVMATKYSRINGVVDYAEATVGSRYAYMVGWFMTTVYYPTLASVLSWLCARYTLALFGADNYASGLCMTLAALFLIVGYSVNSLSPLLAGKLQVTTTVIKLIPLALMAIVGTTAGLINGHLAQNFNSQTVITAEHHSMLSILFSGVVATAFAYEGWIIATGINAELKNAKKNLPLALFIGGSIIIIVYIMYYIGLSGSVTIDALMDKNRGVSFAFTNTFGNIAGIVLIAFIAVSCMGTLNGLMLGCARGIYSIAVRNAGPKPDIFSVVDPKTNVPANSSVFGLLLCALWLFYFYGANLVNIFGLFSFDSSELPIVTVYGLYIPIFTMYIFKNDEKSIFKHYMIPIAAIISSAAMIFAAVYAHGITPYRQSRTQGTFSLPILFYLIIFCVIMIIGMFFMPKKDIKH